MKKSTIEYLNKKGWSKKRIKEVEEIIAKKEFCDKSRSSSKINHILYWCVIFIILLGNFFVSMIIVPLLIALGNVWINVLIVFMGVVFGYIFNSLVIEIEHIPRKSHIIAGTIIPIVAILSISYMVSFSNWIAETFRFKGGESNPFLLSIVYTVAFIMPFLYSVFVTKKIDVGYKNKGYFKEQEKKVSEEIEKKY